jgi:hypothetical protein
MPSEIIFMNDRNKKECIRKNDNYISEKSLNLSIR